ncbi:unnamed protein product [Ostreobium quekettii]|uniref:Secreted protein n=1 Tax=Ostreobium quekettii TaxID=121088 RepID=A0A8S1J1P5_9CHLO|nr:unnamed protein product [Ostreobium quekettii]
MASVLLIVVLHGGSAPGTSCPQQMLMCIQQLCLQPAVLSLMCQHLHSEPRRRLDKKRKGATLMQCASWKSISSLGVPGQEVLACLVQPDRQTREQNQAVAPPHGLVFSTTERVRASFGPSPGCFVQQETTLQQLLPDLRAQRSGREESAEGWDYGFSLR